MCNVFIYITDCFTLIPVGFILGQQKKRGGKEGGLNGGVVHFIAGIKDEYNKIVFMDLQNNNIVFAVKGLNPGVISKVG